jgi:hypothetical protein
MVAVGEPYRQKEEETWATGQRKFRRYLTTLPITVIVRERGLEGYCNQIAQGGLGALLPEIVPVGSVTLLQFVMPTFPSKLRVQAVVRYQIGFQHGFEFLSLNEAEQLAIRQFCSELASVSGP